MNKDDLAEGQRRVMDLIGVASLAENPGEAVAFATAASHAATALKIAAGTWLRTPLEYLGDDQPPIQAIYPEPVDPHRRPCWYEYEGFWLPGYLLKITDDADFMVEAEDGTLRWSVLDRIRFSLPDATQKADA